LWVTARPINSHSQKVIISTEPKKIERNLSKLPGEVIGLISQFLEPCPATNLVFRVSKGMKTKESVKIAFPGITDAVMVSLREQYPNIQFEKTNYWSFQG
jgi:hypothetical protein